MGLSVKTAAIILLLCQSLHQPAQCNNNSTKSGTARSSPLDRLQQNKSKRTVAFMLHNYDDYHPTLAAADASSTSSSTSTTGLNEFYTPVSLSTADVGPSTKQVAAQQVLYEFKQTPTKAVSNVHVDQYYQPVPTSATFNNNNNNNNNNHYNNNNNNSPAQQRQEQELTRNHHHQPNQPHQHGISANGFLTGAETIANPVQHSTLVRHGQNYAQVQFEPLTLNAPHHVQTQQYVPGKYFYVNGKIVYQPNQQQQQQQQHLANNNPYLYANQRNNNAQLLLAQQQLHQKPLLYPAPYVQPPPTNQQKFTKTVPVGADFRHFQAPHPAQYQQITKPAAVQAVVPKRVQPQRQTDNEEQDEETVSDEDEEQQQQQQEQNDDVEEQEEHNDERQQDEEDLHEETEHDGDDDEMDKYFGSYSSFDDHHHDHYEDADEEEEDSDRGSTRYVPKTVHHKRHKKKHNKPDKYSKNKSFKYAENYSSSSKYGDKPSRNFNNNKRKSPKKVLRNNKQSPSHTKHYKAMKYTRQDNGRPRIETIEGRQSKNVPVIHKHKIFRENKWLVTKSTD